MDSMAIIYMAFLLLAIAASWKLPTPIAVALVYLAGIMFLPVSPPAETLPSLEVAGDSPYWVMPFALPADIFFTKAVVASLAALMVTVVGDRQSLWRFRWHWSDLPILAWCLWPLIQSVWTEASPAGWMSSLYLTCVWAVPWILARIHFASRKGQLVFIDSFVGLTLLLLPIVLFETLSDLRVHELVYGPHPFAEVGTERYFGNRPLAFFEDGNQYGLWIACAALLAFWRAKWAAVTGARGSQIAVAGLLFAIAVASQSVGALILLFAGLAMLFFAPALRILRKAILPLLLLISAVMAVYLSGALPLRAIAKETVAGQMVWNALKASGRGSLSWRIGQDQKTLPAIQENLVTGSGQWDWWRELEKRPWGLVLLLIGQFGLIGFGLIAAAFLQAIWTSFSAPVARKSGANSQAGNPGTILAILLVMILLDAMLNAFLILPAIMAAAAISVMPGKNPSRGRADD